jgi:hypothetical protein
MATTSSLPQVNPLPKFEASDLRVGLVQTLRDSGFGEICSNEPQTPEKTSDGLGAALISTFVITLSIVAAQQFNLSFALAVVVAGAILVFLTAVAAIDARISTALLISAWIITGLTQLFGSNLEALAVSHGLPLVLTFTLYWLFRGRLAATAKSMPLLFPIVLIFIFIPLFSADLWRDASRLNPYMMTAVAGLSILPVLLMLRSRLHGSIESVFQVQAKRLETEDEPENTTIKETQTAIGKEGSWLVERGPLLSLIRKSFDPPYASEYASVAGALMATSFKKRITLRLFPLVIAVVTALSAYIYCLAWAAVPIATASEWTNGPVSTESVSLLNQTVHLPTGVYLQGAALLGIVAASVFFAFVLTDDRYSTSLADTLVHEPVKKCLLLAAPYLALVEDQPSKPS